MYELYLGFKKVGKFATVAEAVKFANESGWLGVWNLLGKGYKETWDNSPGGDDDPNTIGIIPKFEKYKNLSQRSGVDSFLIEYGKIFVKFKDESIYLYTTASLGASRLAKMRTAANYGFGLNRYINKEVKYNYESKMR